MEPRWSEPVRAEYVHPREHVTRLALVDSDISRALPLAASPGFGIPHGGRNDRKLPSADVSRDSHRYALNNEVHRRVVQRLRRRLADLYLEAGTAQRLVQSGSEVGIGAIAVVDDHAREINVASRRGVDGTTPFRMHTSVAGRQSRERSARRAQRFSRSFSQVCTSRTLTRPRPTG
jgi:hypothetical protein